FQLRDPAMRDLVQRGLGAGLIDRPGTQIVGGDLDALARGGVEFADVMLRYFETKRPEVEAQMERLGIDAAQAFSIAWVTGMSGFLGLESLDDVITIVDGRAQTAAQRLEQMARALDHLGFSGVSLP